jgi:hypothetical protein
MTGAVSGGCQCGALRYQATGLGNAHLCHCRMCQKAAGNLFAALVGADTLVWTRGTPSRFASSAHVERGFCANCGTPVFYCDTTGPHYALMAGTLDHPAEIGFEYQSGTESRLAVSLGIAALRERPPTETFEPARARAVAASTNQHPDHETLVWSHKEARHG